MYALLLFIFRADRDSLHFCQLFFIFQAFIIQKHQFFPNFENFHQKTFKFCYFLKKINTIVNNQNFNNNEMRQLIQEIVFEK